MLVTRLFVFLQTQRHLIWTTEAQEGFLPVGNTHPSLLFQIGMLQPGAVELSLCTH